MIVARAQAPSVPSRELEHFHARPIAARHARSAPSLAFSAKAGGIDPFNQLVDIANGGDASFSDVTVTGVTYGAGQPTDWIRAQVLGSILPARLAVRAVTGGLPAGVYTATVAVAPFDAIDRPQNVLVTFTVSAP